MSASARSLRPQRWRKKTHGDVFQGARQRVGGRQRRSTLPQQNSDLGQEKGVSMKASPMQGMTARVRAHPPRRASDYLKTPQGWIFLLFGALLLVLLATGERRVPNLLDQDNYLEYFRTTTWDWIVQLYDQRVSTTNFVISMITEELGWRIWVISLNALGLTPEVGVRVTVLVLNALVMIALLGVRRPLLGLILWSVIPFALLTVGLFQIRQGFAFAVAMVLTTRFQRPLTGWVLASFIHTTFAVPAMLLIAIRMFRRRGKWVALGAAGVVALALASSAGVLFRNFGGRRLAEYSGYQDDFTIRLVLLLVAYMFASVLVLYGSWRAADSRKQTTLTELSLMHISLVIYLVAAYFVFPLGKGRVWYCVPLLLAFLIPEIKFKTTAAWWVTGVVLLVLSADVLKSYYEGVYNYFLG
jgi:hypothetical protein